MNQTLLLLIVGILGSIVLMFMTIVALRVAVMPPPGTHPTVAQRIQLYAASIAMLMTLGQLWNEHPGIPSGPSTDVEIASAG